MEILMLLLKGSLGGCAAAGFAILFNVPARTLPVIWVMGTVVILVKTILMDYFGVSIILSSFICATISGFIGIYASHIKKSPPLVFSIPSVIPAIPGIFIYKFMLGAVKLSGKVGDDYTEIFDATINNGLKASFIVIGLAIGVILPNLLYRKESFKKVTK